MLRVRVSTPIRAAVLNSAPGELELEELHIDDPEPDEVLIRVLYAGLCHSDLHEIDGTFAADTPIVLGHEVVGEVVKVGSAAIEFGIGSTVVTCLSVYCGSCQYCLVGQQTLCERRMELQQVRARPKLTNSRGSAVRATAGIGGFAEMVLVHKNSAVVIPSDVRPQTASVLGCAATTGMGSVLHSAGVRPGQGVAVLGLGGIGFSVIQAARIAGAGQIIGVDLVSHKLELAKVFGATDVVNAREVDPVETVRELTDGGSHHSFEAVGTGPTAAQAFAMLRPGGVATVLGMIPDEHSIPLRGSELFLQEKTLRGSFMGSNHFKVDIPMYLELDRAGLLNLDGLVTAEFSLDTINKGFEALATGNEIRVVVRIGAR